MRTFCIPNTSKNALIPPNVVMNTNITSLPMNVISTYTAGVQVVYTGTPTGTFELQCSCDPGLEAQGYNQATVYQPTNWTTIANSPQAVTAAGDLVWNLQDIGYNWLRLVYTDTSGGDSTAVLTVATFNSKTV